MSDELPCLFIPPDHKLAAKLFDLTARQHVLIMKCSAAVMANDASEVRRYQQLLEPINTDIEAVTDEYRQECGAPPQQKVSLTYDKNGLPVVTARPGPTKH